METTNVRCGYVAIVGRPNVGKSTLMNNLLHYKLAIVSPKPQTTRHRILGILSGENFQIVFLDTPGLVEPKYLLHEAMLKAARRALEEADMVCFMVEAGEQPHGEDLLALDRIRGVRKPMLLVINKIDLVAKPLLLPLIDAYRREYDFVAIVPISALHADGLDILQGEILKHLPEGSPLYPTDQITTHPERFIVAEVIREKIFQRYGEEVPYSTTVMIEEFREQPERKDFIRAIIYVERESQKAILIGKGGAALKEVGKLARQEIEALLGRPVYLELWVKVKEKWRDSERDLKEFGYY